MAQLFLANLRLFLPFFLPFNTLCFLIQTFYPTVALVCGFDRRTLSAVVGCALGIGVTCITGILFTTQFKIHGAVMSYSESLLYAGYQQLDLTQIFMASIFSGKIRHDGGTGGSGHPDHHPAVGLLRGLSGPDDNVYGPGHSVGHHFQPEILASEILRTVVGSFGLCTVAPLTASTSGVLLTRQKNRERAGLDHAST